MDFNARFCINSMLSERYLGRLVCHTGHAYSSTGLTTLMYTVTRSNWLMPALFNWYNIILYTLLAALFTIQSTCLFQDKSLDKVTPSNLAYSTVSTILPSMTMLGIEFLTFSSGVKQITISLDFVELIFIQLSLVQLIALSIDSCITDTSVVLQISNSVLSSTYLYNGTFDSRSLTYNKKHFGPDNVTCGIPPLGLPDLEQLLPIITSWLRSRRKAPIHLTIWRGKPLFVSFSSNMWWLMRSNALLKSSMTTRIYVLSISVASYHLCVIATRASVVDVPAIPPNCLLSMASQTIMSVFTDISGLVFGKGIMLADFHTVGRTPSRNEQLKILAGGAARQSACSFNTHAGMLSGPVDLLVLTFRRAETVSSTLIINSSGNSSCTVNTLSSLSKRGKWLLTYNHCMDDDNKHVSKYNHWSVTLTA